MGISVTRVLCPVDLSDQSRHALDCAVAIARHFGADVTALYVIPPVIQPVPTLDSPAYPPYLYTADELAVIEHEVEAFVRPEQAERPIVSRVVQGYVVGEILEAAATVDASLIVMGTHGRGGFQRLVLGSVVERVLAHATCPVVAIPPQMPDATPFGTQLFPNILCAVDYTPSSLRALEYARVLARETHAKLTLLHVAEMPAVDAVPADVGNLAGPDSPFVAAARGRLDTMLPADVAGQALVRTGKPYRAILDAVHEQGSDLIVLGAHGGLASVLGLGSTTNRVLRDATCPVMCVRA